MQAVFFMNFIRLSFDHRIQSSCVSSSPRHRGKNEHCSWTLNMMMTGFGSSKWTNKHEKNVFFSSYSSFPSSPIFFFFIRIECMRLFQIFLVIVCTLLLFCAFCFFIHHFFFLQFYFVFISVGFFARTTHIGSLRCLLSHVKIEQSTNFINAHVHADVYRVSFSHMYVHVTHVWIQTYMRES